MARRQSRYVSVTLEVDSEGAVKGIRDASGGVQRFGKDLDDTGKRADGFGKVVHAALGVVAVAAVYQLVRSMRQLISRGRELLNLSAVMEEIGASFDATFGSMSGHMETFIDEWANMAGLTSHEARKLIGTTGAVADGMGLAEDARAELSEGVARLAGDLAAYRAVKPEQVFHALTSALVGETEALKTLGIVIRQTDIVTQALLNTGKSHVDQLTQQDRAVATLELAYMRAGNAVGHLESHQDVAYIAGMKANAQWRELVETFANELIPAATALNERMVELSGNEELQEWVRTTAALISEQLVRGIELASGAIQVLIDHREGIKTTVTWIARLTAAVIAYNVAFRTFLTLKGLGVAALSLFRMQAGLTATVQLSLGAATSLLTTRLRLLFATLIANPFAAVLAVLAAVASSLLLFRQRTDESTTALRRQRDAAIQAADAVRDLDAAAAGTRVVQARIELAENQAELDRLKRTFEAFTEDASLAAMSGFTDEQRDKLKADIEDLTSTVEANQREVRSLSERVTESLGAQIAEVETLLRLERDLGRGVADEEKIKEYEARLALLQAERQELERIGATEETTAGTGTTSQRLERERALQRMRVEVMEDGIAKTVALIDLEFDEREARMRERYGRLSDEEIRLLQQQRHNAIVAAFERMDIGDLPEVDVEIQLNPIINVGDQLRGDIAVVDGQLRAGLLRSINAVDQALQDMGMAFGAAVTDEDRERIRLMIEELELLRQKMVEVGDTGVDIGAQLEGVLASSIVSFSELIGEAFAGLDETSGTMSERVLLILTGMVRQIGEILVATGVGMLALRAVLKNPFASIAAGVAMIALAAGAQAAIQRTISSRNEASSESTRPVQRSSESASYTPFGGARAKGGPISSGYSYLVGEQGPELILPKHDGFVFPASVTRGILGGQQRPDVGQQSVSIQVEPTRRVTTEQINIDHIQLVRKVEEGIRVRDKHLGRL